ncbi:hypothetical protein PRJ39_02465 [Lysobacter enzymogenes]|uniref:Imm32 family immunity protein n=1 Tax=Lysobacter enzymogenes TaxID=69 RepID=UPI0037494431
MKLTGYSVEDQDAEDIRFIQLAEISLAASPAELRRMATFFNNAADTMERMGDTYDHEHLSDRQPGFDDSPHFVVFRAT